MKIKNLSVIAAIVVVLGLINSTRAYSASTILKDISNIHQIEVRGNVQLYVSDATTDQVKVYNKYYAESALVQNKNGVLRISSYSNEKLVVWVSAKDLRSVSAYNNSEVSSFGTLSEIEFNLNLHDNAYANLNLTAFNATLTIKDNAVANLKGSAENFSLNKDVASKIQNENFTAAHLYENRPSFAATASKQTSSI